MGGVVFLFPGQGSQYAGMGRELADTFPAARQVFEEADRVLGFPLSQLCFSGPEEQLKLTENTQPAILTVSIAAYRLLEEKGVRPNFVAGHSLGEYSALVAAGALSLRRRRPPGAAAREIYAGGGSRGRGRHGRDSGNAARPRGGDLPQSHRRPGRAREFEFARSDGHFRRRGGGEKRRGTSLGERRQARRNAAGFSAFPQRTHASGARAPGEGPARHAVCAT